MATTATSTPAFKPLGEAPRGIDDIAAQERASTLPYWNATVAFQLGCALRTRLLAFDAPAVVHISTLSTPPHVLFHCVTHAGTALDNDFWVARKRNTVIRWQASTWRLHNKFGGDEDLFRAKFGLGASAGEYAIHGGGVPVFVSGVEGPVAVVVVSGLKQWDDHQVVVEGLAGVLAEMEGGVAA
ncbi:uncharacterized protein M421DRAFT_249298 [Didymella exigua CBS 183.55]|uniref:DUF336-domain-containing protein n=1 Tax=Didymella exigua CBS 183.55 TaxID=1150837 RepID=A0A6A5S016_9PLEO|nr:uncharacterized protein M421DRAFT_249298 [Didymella exigua CBS 183.55]KAF1932794.1 hypothetical protein M421DRAFT_249298 [Didymella exigua CBS 183.55]